MNRELLKPYLSYRRYETLENVVFPEAESGLDIRFKVINNLSYDIYVHSLFPVGKVESNKRGVSNEVVIMVEIKYPSSKKLITKMVIDEAQLNRTMVYIKELNILICNMDDYLADNNRENGFLTRDITDVSKYVQAALEYRINNTGNPPIYFHFNDPSKTYNSIFLSMFGRACEITIDNNPNEKAVGEIIIDYGKNIDKKIIDIAELFSKKKTRYISDDCEILITLDKEMLVRAMNESRLHKNQLFSYEALEQEKELIKEKFDEEKEILKSKIESIKSQNELKEQDRLIKIAELENTIKRLKVSNEEVSHENESLRMAIKSGIEVKKLSIDSEKTRVDEAKIDSDYTKMRSDEKITELKLEKEKSSAISGNISDIAKVIGVSLSLVASGFALYKVVKPKPKDVIRLAATPKAFSLLFGHSTNSMMNINGIINHLPNVFF